MNMTDENEFYEDEDEWGGNYSYEDEWEDEDEDEDEWEDEDEDDDLEEYEVGSRLISTNTVTVEFSYESDTPLLFVLDEIINYVVEHELDYATINSMQTELVTDLVDSLVLTVTFNA